MTLTEFTTRKLYYGFPIFVLAYRDDQFGVNITTCSSSYSLGAMLQFGLGSDSNAAEQIAKAGACSLNIFTRDQMPLVETAGYLHKREKMTTSGATYHMEGDVPVLDDALISECLTIDHHECFQNYTNFTAVITHRFAQSNLLDEKGHLKQTEITPVLYAGDARKRIYRFLNDEVVPGGDYLRQQKKRH